MEMRKGGIRILKSRHDGGNGFISYEITIDPEHGAPDFEATMDAMMDAIELHHMKAVDYDGDENEFGIKGELIGITRKVGKLKRIWWHGRDAIFEGAQELVMDLIGNCLLALRMQKSISDKYSAAWRDNHGNKPMFGPGPADPPSWLPINKKHENQPGVHEPVQDVATIRSTHLDGIAGGWPGPAVVIHPGINKNGFGTRTAASRIDG